MREKIAYMVVDKKKPKINVNNICANKKDFVLNKSEKWVTIIIKIKSK